MMTLIRLVPQATDIAVMLNIPKMPGGDDEEVRIRNGKLGTAVDEGRRIVEEVWNTMEIKNWGLFGEEKGEA